MTERRNRSRGIFILISAVIMLLAMSQAVFADDWNVESISFAPASDTVKMSRIMRTDNDGVKKLDLSYRRNLLLWNCFFTSGDSCTVSYKDGTTQTFKFKRQRNPNFAEFRAVGGSEVILLEALPTDISKEIRGGVEGSADELAAITGPNRLQIGYGVYDDETGPGQTVVCDCTITVIEDRAHDCVSALRGRGQNDPTCEASGFSKECWFCQICGKFYLDPDAEQEVAKEEVFLPALDHDWGEWEVTKEATCLEKGEETRSCSFGCGNSETRATDALGHDWQLISEKKPTQTEEGLEVYECSRCGEKNERVIPKLDPKPDTPSEDTTSPDAPSKDDPSQDTPSPVTPSPVTPSKDDPSQDTPSPVAPSNDSHSQTAAPQDVSPTAGSAGANTADAVPAAGSTAQITGGTLAVTSDNTVAFTGADKSKKSITIPAEVILSGRIYKVTAVSAKAFRGSKATSVTIGRNVKSIRKNAFRGSNVRTIIVKSKHLTKASVKGCLKGSKVKTIRVRVGRKSVNSKYVKKYKKIFTKKNAGRKVTVKR